MLNLSKIFKFKWSQTNKTHQIQSSFIYKTLKITKQDQRAVQEIKNGFKHTQSTEYMKIKKLRYKTILKTSATINAIKW